MERNICGRLICIGDMIHRMETKQLDRFPLPIWSPWRIKLDTIIQIETFINALAVLGLPHSLTDSLIHSLTALDSKLSAFQSKPKHLPDLTNRHDLPTWSTYLPDLPNYLTYPPNPLKHSGPGHITFRIRTYSLQDPLFYQTRPYQDKHGQIRAGDQPTHRCIGDTTWKYGINSHHEYMCHVSWMYGSQMNSGFDNIQWIWTCVHFNNFWIICMGHTDRAPEDKVRRPEPRRVSNKMSGPSRVP